MLVFRQCSAFLISTRRLFTKNGNPREFVTLNLARSCSQLLVKSKLQSKSQVYIFFTTNLFIHILNVSMHRHIFIRFRLCWFMVFLLWRKWRNHCSLKVNTCAYEGNALRRRFSRTTFIVSVKKDFGLAVWTSRQTILRPTLALLLRIPSSRSSSSRRTRVASIPPCGAGAKRLPNIAGAATVVLAGTTGQRQVMGSHQTVETTDLRIHTVSGIYSSFPIEDGFLHVTVVLKCTWRTR